MHILMKTFSINVLLSIIGVLIIVSCDNDDIVENVDDSYIDETLNYSISTDKSTYFFLDTIYWSASLTNLGDDTISFDDQGTGQFFNWILVDTLGTYFDGWVTIDCVSVYSLMPDDELESHWTTVINSFISKYLNSGYYYGIMKPWYNYDSLSFDSTKFFIDKSAYEDGYKKLSIKTNATSYTWQQGESKDFISIQGTIINDSDATYYSRLGDGFGPPEPDLLYIAAYSGGYIEKYSESEKIWMERELKSILIEGVRVVPIKPSQDYSIFGPLTKSREEDETGTYRIRIDYYDIENPDSTVIPFQDFSNTFEIK